MALFFYVLYVIVAVLLLFGMTVFVHELGHFLAARRFHMIVEVFSLGFGPALWKKKSGDVLYKIAWFPIGGYVALPQMDHAPEPPAPGAPPSERAPPPPVAPWKKIVVALAGAGGNMLFAVALAWIIYWVGKPSTPAERSSLIGYLETNSAAYAAGLRIGDEILSVNRFAVSNWNEFLQECAMFETVELGIRPAAGTNFSVTLPTEKNAIGLRWVDGLSEISLCKVMTVEPGWSAEEAGLQMGDQIVSFNGVNVLSIEHMTSLVRQVPDETVPLVVNRDETLLHMTVVPRLDPALGRARIGIRFDNTAVDYDRVVHIPPAVQIRQHSQTIFRVLRALLTPKEARAASQSLGGPLIIFYVFQDMVRKGLILALWFTCMLNVNLAIINLFPLPVLDGGHILFSLWEAVTRRPVHPTVFRWLTQLFVVLLLGVFLLLTVKDARILTRIFAWKRLIHTTPAEPTPTPTLPEVGVVVIPPTTNGP